MDARSRYLALVVLALVAVPGCAKQRTARPTPPAPPVKTVVARPGVVTPNETLAGIVAPFQNVAMQSTLVEPADAVDVKEGDAVYRGEVLAQLDTADLRASLAANLATAASDAANTTKTVYQGGLAISQGRQGALSAQAAVSQAQQTAARDALDLARYRSLYANGYISQQQVTASLATVRNDQQAIRSAQASLASAQASVSANGTLGGDGLQTASIEQARASQQVALAQADQVRTQIAKATIVSPIDGVVVNRNLNVGEYPGSRQIFTLQQTDPIYAILRGSGRQIATIATGARATIAASDIAAQNLPGSVAGVLNQINPGSTDFVVKVALRNTRGKLRPGMAVSGTIVLPRASGIRIPTTAFTDDTHASVLLVDADRTVRSATVVQVVDDGRNAVVRGIPAGSRVIANGQTGVNTGEKVAIAR